MTGAMRQMGTSFLASYRKMQKEEEDQTNKYACICYNLDRHMISKPERIHTKVRMHVRHCSAIPRMTTGQANHPTLKLWGLFIHLSRFACGALPRMFSEIVTTPGQQCYHHMARHVHTHTQTHTHTHTHRHTQQ